MSFGGGGVSGEVVYPDYIADTHALLLAAKVTDGSGGFATALSTTLNTDYLTEVDNAYAAAPFISSVYTNPSTLFADVATELSNFTSEVADYQVGEVPGRLSTAAQTVAAVDLGDLSHTLNTSGVKAGVLSIATEAIDEIQAIVPNIESQALSSASTAANATEIQNLVDQFDTNRETERERQISQFNAQMSDGMAVHSSAYMFGMALLQAEQARETAEFEKELRLNAWQIGYNAFYQSFVQMFQQGMLTHRTIYDREISTALSASQLSLEADRVNKSADEQRYLQALQITYQLLTNRTELKRTISQLITEQKRVEFVATHEYEGAELDREVRDAKWGMEVLDQGMAVLGAPGGGSRALPEKPSRSASALGGGLQGAAAGAAAGSTVPGVGTVAGAILGAGLGSVGGLLQ